MQSIIYKSPKLYYGINNFDRVMNGFGKASGKQSRYTIMDSYSGDIAGSRAIRPADGSHVNRIKTIRGDGFAGKGEGND